MSTAPLRRLRAAALSLAALTVPAVGQTVEPVDQTIEDITILAESLREIEVGLGQPNDFRQVYRYQDDQLMRVQGGLYAVFPESVYVKSEDGQVLPTIPPNTTFYIGPPPGPLVAPPSPSFELRLDLRVPPGLVNGSAASSAVPRVGIPRLLPAAAPPPPPDSRSMVIDPTYRADRVRALMRYAARARRLRFDRW